MKRIDPALLVVLAGVSAALPPVVAWVAGRTGGWGWTWGVTGACALAGMGLAARLVSQPQSRP